MTGLHPGERVHVEAFEGTVYTVTAFNGHKSCDLVRVQTSDHGVVAVPESLVTRVNPAGWPPVCGDVWQAAGHEWYVRDAGTTDAIVIASFRPQEDIRTFFSSSHGDDNPEPGGSYGVEAFMRLRPVLVRRRA